MFIILSPIQPPSWPSKKMGYCLLSQPQRLNLPFGGVNRKDNWKMPEECQLLSIKKVDLKKTKQFSESYENENLWRKKDLKSTL